MRTPGVVALLFLLAAPCLSAGEKVSLAGATALVVRPENSYNGYDLTLSAALLRRGFAVTPGEPEMLADAAKLARYDLVATNLKRGFPPEQVAGLKAYLRAGGAVYGNWGGPMGCPELLRVCGVKNARSVYIKELRLLDSPLAKGMGEQRWAFPQFVGHMRLGDGGSEMVAFDLLDGIEVARDTGGRCLGALREEGAGRCAVLGFCPSNYRFVTDEAGQAGRVLDNLLAWLLPRGARRRPMPETIEVSLPRGATVGAVTVGGRALAKPAVRTQGSLTTVTVPIGSLAEGKAAVIQVTCRLPKRGRQIETWIHDPTASSFTCFEPAQAADFLARLHVATVQPLLRYEGGVINCTRGIPGDRPRECFLKYQGDLLADYIQACHARGIQVIGGLYLDWRRFERHLADAPAKVQLGQAAPAKALRQPVCPLDASVQEHNLSIVRTLLDNYPGLDGVILDDNFELDQDPCYCEGCLGRFAAHCGSLPARPDPKAEADGGGAAWRAFWRERKLDFCRRVRELCAARGKPVGGWTAQRGPLAFKGVFDFAGDMVYVEPPCSVAPLWPLTGDFPVVTLLWGMDRSPAGIEADFTEAIRAGSSIVGFWISYARVEGVADNPWSLGTLPGQRFGLTPGSLSAIERAFAGAEKDWRDYYRDNLVRGDLRFAVTSARLGPKALRLTIKRLPRPAPQRIAGPVDLSGLPASER